MKKIFWCLLGLSVLLLGACGSKNDGQAQTNGVSVNVSDTGVDVSAPGVNISTNEGGANVSVPGVNVSTDAQGNASVSVPGVNVNVNGQAEEAESK